LWKQSAHAKLLKQPPAATSSAKNSGLFQHSIQYAAALEAAAHVAHEQLLQQQEPGDVQCFLQDVLASRAVATLARLLVWLQQQPGLLQLPELAADDVASSSSHSHGALWLTCNRGALMALTDAKPRSGWGCRKQHALRLAHCVVARQLHTHELA
jgi:hypothetical protein